MIPGSNVSRTLARTGVDWVLVDCEFLCAGAVAFGIETDLLFR